jgi:hypothetical protein
LLLFAKFYACLCGKLAKKTTPKRQDSNPDLFEISLVQVINLNHPLVKLASELDWEGIR